MNNSRNNPSPHIPWGLIIVGFIAFWPVGLGLLVYKIVTENNATRERRPNWEEQLDDFADDVHVIGNNFKEDFQREFSRTRDAARQSRSSTQRTSFSFQRETSSYQRSYGGTEPRQSQKSQKKSAKIKDGKLMTALGAVLGLGGLAACLNELAFWLPYYPLYALKDAMAPFLVAGVGAGMCVWGQFKHRKARRFRKLLNLIGDHKQIDIRTLAEAMPCSYNRACDLVQDMVDDGLLGPKAYIDMSTGYLVLDGQGVTQKPKPEPKPETPEEARSSDKQVLAQIRQINQAISDPVLSRKIDRIEEITGHILDYQKRHPEKASDLHRFLNYYLPTTLKILNSYAELDSQGVDGANITATKERIENMMDLVVEGFEKQLDKLFEGDMMDISSDISVMEKMLSRDGLAGGIKIPKADEEEKSADSGIRLTLDPEGTVSQAKAAPAREEPAASDQDAAQPFPQSFSQYSENPFPARRDPTTDASWADGFYRRTKDDLEDKGEN
ncbi:MAG: 5-bromo-4-chloroindolyl phosphate hydrolysis family protein [Clostridiales bacterium]|nr:5-bromo-4-chloroindolyl phosphate hydrolysis family protein [Clostridiales bacterium]